MRWFIITLLASLAALPLLTADAKQPPAKAEKHPGFETLKSFAGTWVQADDSGKPTDTVISVVKLIAGGSAVHETLFPGAPHEMVTVYHRDGKDVVATHYCAAGNQPKYKLDPKSTDTKLILAFAGGTNFDPAKDMHMHEGHVTIIDKDTIQTEWIGYDKGKPDAGHRVSMKLIRKK